MTAKKSGPTRVDTNPYSKLIELMDEQGIMQFKVQVTRQNPQTKQWGSLTWWPGMSPDDIANIEEIVTAQYGGGNYVVGIANNADQRQKLINYAFTIEGPPKFPGGNPNMQNPYNPYGPQQQGGFYPQPQPGHPQGFQGPQINPAVMQPPMGYPYPYPPPYYPPPQAPQKDPGPSPVEARLSEQNELLKRQLDDMNRKFDEEKHQRELDRRENDTSRKLDEMKAANDRQITELKTALESSTNKDSDALTKTMLELSKTNQEAIVEMKKSEVESTRANLEMQMKQIEKDFDQRKQMMDWVQQAQDPSKHAELIDRFGQYAASNLNMMMQLAQSGILAPHDNEPMWMEPMRELIKGAQDFGNKYFEHQERKTTRGRQHSRGAYQFGPGRQLPPGAQQQGYGGQTQAPQQPPPQQQQQPPPQPPPTSTGDIQVGEIPESMKQQMEEIGKAIYFKREPYKVAEMMYNVVDYGRYWAHVPSLRTPVWMEPIFERPKDVIVAILQKHAPQVPLIEEYLDEVQRIFFEIHGQFLAEQEATQQAQQEQPPEQPPVQLVKPPPQSTPGEGPGEDEPEPPEEPPTEPPKKSKPKKKSETQTQPEG